MVSIVAVGARIMGRVHPVCSVGQWMPRRRHWRHRCGWGRHNWVVVVFRMMWVHIMVDMLLPHGK